LGGRGDRDRQTASESQGRERNCKLLHEAIQSVCENH
jgi:hypothetical protein